MEVGRADGPQQGGDGAVVPPAAPEQVLDVVARAGRDVAQVQAALKAGRAALQGAVPARVEAFAAPEAWRAARGEVAGRLDVARVVESVGAARAYGAVVMHSRCLASTQTVVHETDGLPEGSVCVADTQTAGRGRGDNLWTSPPGCLLFTMRSATREPSTLPLMQYVACLAIVEGVRGLPGMEGVRVNIKWPNDIYVNGSVKIGGILCQSVLRGRECSVSIGVGLNVENEEPTTCLRALATAPVSREDVLIAILERYEALHTEFQDPARGFSPRIQAEYERHWLHSGQELTLEREGNRRIVVQGLSVSSGGALLAKDKETGALYELFPDGNRLDFFKGLVSKKIVTP